MIVTTALPLGASIQMTATDGTIATVAAEAAAVETTTRGVHPVAGTKMTDAVQDARMTMEADIAHPVISTTDAVVATAEAVEVVDAAAAAVAAAVVSVKA